MGDLRGGLQQRNEHQLANLRRLALDDAQSGFNAFINFLPAKLQEFADKPGLSVDSFYFEKARANIIASRQQLSKIFCREIDFRFAELVNTPQGDNFTNHWREENLSLVSYDDMEEEVTITAIVQRTESLLSKELWSLAQRMSVLCGGGRLPENQLPVSPAAFCHAMRKAFASIELMPAVKLVIYKVFEKKFFSELARDIYNNLNGTLAKADILPNLRYEITNKSSSLSPSRNAPAVQNPLRKAPGVGQLAGGATVIATQYSVAQLEEATRRLQVSDASEISDDKSFTAIKPVDIAQARDQLLIHLQAVVGGNKKPSLSSDDMKIIDLVGMLFEYMLNDEQLPDIVKTLLSHLHTPFIKVALADRDFFDHEDHPARLLMNSLADAGVKWVGNDGKSEYGVLATIRSTVKQVVDEYQNDARLFARLLLDFTAYIKKVEIKVQMLEKRAAEKARGEDRLKQVKYRVNKEIKSRIEDRELPSAILLLLLQPWADYLAFLLLRYGEKSESWEQALSLVDDLLWGLELENTPENRLQWRQNYPWIEATIKKGFESIGYDPGKAVKLKNAIDKVYAFSYKSERSMTPQELKSRLIRLADEKAGQQEDINSLAPAVKQVLEELCDLSFGTWFEFRDGHREKLAWFNKSSMQFLFVDQSGRRTGMRQGSELASRMLNGELRIIHGNQQPLFERTLEVVYNDLSRKVEAQQSG